MKRYFVTLAALALAGWLVAAAPPPAPAPAAPPAPTAATAATAAPTPTAATAAKKIEIEIEAGDDSGDRVVTGDDLTVKAGEVVAGDVVVTAGDLDVEGTVKGDAVVTGGNLRLGPTAVVEGDCVVTGGKMEVSPTAKIGGERVVIAGPGLEGLKWLGLGKHVTEPVRASIKLVKEFAFFGFLMFLALLLVIFLPRQFARVEEHLAEDFPRSALLGVAAMVLLPVSLVILVVSILGIPFAPLVLVAAILAALVGYITLGRVIGGRILKNKPALLQTLVGLALLQAAAFIGDIVSLPGGAFDDVGGVFRTIGTIIFLGGAGLGMGAVIYSRFGGWPLARSRAAFKKNGGNGQKAPAEAGPPATPAA